MFFLHFHILQRKKNAEVQNIQGFQIRHYLLVQHTDLKVFNKTGFYSNPYRIDITKLKIPY